MTRFAWLQSRTQTLVAAGLIAAIAVTAAVTGVQLSHLFHRDVAHCTSGCGFAIEQFLGRDSFLEHTLDILARAVPALLGLFWGAPLLAREFETGTYRLAWSQSVSRSRWVLTKLALGALATVVLAGALSLTITWWYSSRDQVGGFSPYAVFDRRDVVPIAYALFAFAVGALIGAVLRRTVPAMAASLGVFVLVRVGISLWVRPHLLSPLHKTLSLPGAGRQSPVRFGFGSSNGGPLRLFVQGQGPPRSWTLSSQLVTNAGHHVSPAQSVAFVHQNCPAIPPPPGAGVASEVTRPDDGTVDAIGRCMAQAAKSFHLVVTYQPANRYWTFQWLELGIFVALSLAAVAGCFWWVTRRAN